MNIRQFFLGMEESESIPITALNLPACSPKCEQAGFYFLYSKTTNQNLLHRPRKLNVWKLQFIYILKIIHNSVLLQFFQKSVHKDWI